MLLMPNTLNATVHYSILFGYTETIQSLCAIGVESNPFAMH